MYLSLWWVTVMGNSLGIPPEMNGLCIMGPLLSATNLFHVADRKRPFFWKGLTGS